jgi:hypothetical protein
MITLTVQQNRPYSLINIMDNLHGRIAKPIAMKVLEELVSKKILTIKEYGKFLLYIAN